MKSIYKYLALIGLMLLVLAACKSEDDNNEEPAPTDPTAENKKALGLSAGDLLSGGTYKSLTVEFAYAPNFRPKDETLSAFRTMLNERINKPGGINFVQTVIDEQPNAPFTIQEIRDIEDNVRTQYTDGDNIAVFVFFSNGSSQNDEGNSVTLGTAYRNTSVVVYQNTLRVITNDIPDEQIFLETFTLNHEFGHILGLTNIQNDDIHANHEDTVNTKHCFVDDCLMFFELNRMPGRDVETLVQLSKSRMPVPTFDSLCIEDLQAKGGK